MTKAESLKLTAGTKVICTVTALCNVRYIVLEVRPRDGYLKLSGERMWCPPHNFKLESPEAAAEWEN